MKRTAAVLAAAVVALVPAAPGSAAAAEFPAFGLPAAPGQDVSSAGIHSESGTATVMNAIDLTPRDGVVRAPLAGTVRFQHCSGGDWVVVDHAGGWRTGYYHLEGIAVTDGRQVAAGAVLGNVGNALPCGGSSTGAHVHFTLWRLDAAARSPEAAGDWDGISHERLATDVAEAVGVALSGRTFGGWTLREGTEQYSGTATRVSTGEVVPLPGTLRHEP
jgi:LasA protease